MKKCLVFVSMLHLFQSYGTSPVCDNRKKLVIDHDGGADDAMAIFMALIYEEYFNGPDIVGLTTVHGNVNESQSFINTQRILSVANREVPIYRGMNKSLVVDVETDYFFGKDGLGDNELQEYTAIRPHPSGAVIGLIELSKKYEGRLTVMAIGALTNIAMAIRLDPGFIGRLSQLYVGAGTINTKDNQYPEFNVQMDVEAYRVVAAEARKDKVTFIPFSEIKKSLNLSREWRENVLGKIPTKIMLAQNKYERISIETSDRWTLLDPAVAAIVLDANMVEEYQYSNNSVILCGKDRGVNTNDLISDEPNVKLVYTTNRVYYKNLLIKIFSAELNKRSYIRV